MTPPDLSVYDASSITVLPGLEAVRQNPSMYIGSIGPEGLHQLVYEVVDNSIDELVAGQCTHIQVVLGEDGSISVEDNGRGIPVDFHSQQGCSAAEVVLTTLHSGGKFVSGSYSRTAGIHGVGVSCVNALSEWLTLDVWRNGRHYRQAYARGVPVTPLIDLEDSDRRGTRVTFLPDTRIFDEGIRFSFETLARRLEDLAFLHPGVHITFEDRLQGRTKIFQYESGILGFIACLNEQRVVIHADPIHIQLRADDVEIDCALQWTTAWGEHVQSYVNSIHTIYGGAHVSGLKTALTRAINLYADEAHLLNAENGERITTFDIMEGLTGVLSVKMSNPRFEGQTKTRLTSRLMKDRVDGVIYTEFVRVLRRDSLLALQVVGRALDASRARLAARRASDRARFENVATIVSDEVYRKQFGIRSKNWHDSCVWLTDQELLQSHARHLKVEGKLRLLDVCCGSGIVGSQFKDKVEHSVGLDITPEMVALAGTRLDEVVQGTVYEIPFPEASFDVVVTREVLHILPWPEKPVSQVFRVLRPGGQFIVGQILPYGPLDAPWMFRIFKKKQPLIFTQFLEEDFRRLLLGAGFVDIEMTEYRLWEPIDRWIDTHETTTLHRHEIRDLYYNAPQEARAVHPFEILPSGEIRDLWRWCVFSAFKPGK